MLDMLAQSYLQGINYEINFLDGFRHQIHLRIKLLHARAVTWERRSGCLKEGHIKNGSQQVPSRCSGFMENVCPCHIPPPDATL